MHVDFDIIKFASTYMCMYMNVDFDNIIFVSTDIYVCGFRYDQIRFYIYMCMCMYVDFDIIKFVSTYTICICVYTCMWISIFYIYMCMYIYVDFDIIKCRYFRYMCMYMMWISILTNLFLQTYVYVHVCGLRYHQISLQ